MKKDCNRIRNLIVLSLSQELSNDELWEIEKHIKKCGACRRFYSLMKTRHSLSIEERQQKFLKREKLRKQFLIFSCVFVAFLAIYGIWNAYFRVFPYDGPIVIIDDEEYGLMDNRFRMVRRGFEIEELNTHYANTTTCFHALKDNYQFMLGTNQDVKFRNEDDITLANRLRLTLIHLECLDGFEQHEVYFMSQNVNELTRSELIELAREYNQLENGYEISFQFKGDQLSRIVLEKVFD